ncbi:MAG: hypothetical protein E7039_04250 [Lentisphaerae bacterium]|nr:hypothetical protein [Lentisphaerota bacterium]
MLQYRLRSKFMWVLLCCAMSPLMLNADKLADKAENVDFSKRFMKKYGKHHIVIRQKINNNKIKGSMPIDRTVEKCADRFYKALEYLPDKLIRKTRLKYVTFVRNLKLNNQYASGIASGDTIYLTADFSQKTVFHEFFHIFDPQRENPQWSSLNEKNFIYTGSKFYEREFDRNEKRQVKKNKRKNAIRESFVSQYAMSFEWEDRAETFAYMIVEGKKFLKRTKNPVIQAKMMLIMDMFVRQGLLDQSFWDKHFDCKFNVKNRFYSGQTNSGKLNKK